MPTIKIHYFSDDLPRLQKTGKGDCTPRRPCSCARAISR